MKPEINSARPMRGGAEISQNRLACDDITYCCATENIFSEIAECVSEKQAEKLASFCPPSGLKKVFGDSELMRTAECFIECDLNISAAARALYMHRNTMMYRLDKIKRLTGLDIRSFNSAVAFRLLYAVCIKDRTGK